jgi:hypothetical protein
LKNKNTINKEIMKTQNNFFFQSLGENQLNNLVKEVKETVATNVAQVNPKSNFGMVDLWNLERSRRTRIVRRHLA